MLHTHGLFAPTCFPPCPAGALKQLTGVEHYDAENGRYIKEKYWHQSKVGGVLVDALSREFGGGGASRERSVSSKKRREAAKGWQQAGGGW